MNIKKLFPENKMSKKKVLEFFDKKGFYVVLMLCIIIVAGAAFYVTQTKIISPDSSFDAKDIIPEDTVVAKAGDKLAVQSSVTNATGTTTVSAADPKAAANDKADAPSVQGTDNKAAATTTTTKQQPDAKTTSGTNENISFAVPVFGDISLGFAKDKLVYSKTLEEWRTHTGIDIASAKGTAVKAVADGVVSDIKNDPRYGIIVVVDHQNGYKSLYANLASSDVVSVNQRIKQGDLVGSVGNTAAIESAEQSHLHFEVLKNGDNVDPTVFLPKK